MCGIAGMIHFDGQLADSHILKKMTDSISHRGPDGEGLWINGPIGLGHRRLSIIDLSDAGKQPMSNETGDIWIVFNGEIYNFLQLKDILLSRGHKFHSATDSETIIHAYEEWGSNCLNHLDGMFAFALWDNSLKQLWLVRDRLGVKPLFYYRTAGCLIFGSEIKAILQHPAVERRVDFESLAYFLGLNYMPAPNTLFSGIRQLEPAHCLLVNPDGHVQETEYWDMLFEDGKHRKEQYWIDEFLTLFDQSVKSRLVSDVPFGAFLSGGVDSSSVVHSMSIHLKQPVETFTIGFGEDTFDELAYARQAAGAAHAVYHEKIVDASQEDILPKIVWHSEEPTADSSMVAVYHLARFARENVTMVLAGDGADEILAGYETYPAYFLHQLYRKIPRFINQRILLPLLQYLPVRYDKVSWDYKLRSFLSTAGMTPEDAHAARRMIFDAAARKKLLSPVGDRAGVDADFIDLYRHMFNRCNTTDPLSRMLYVDTRFYLPNDMIVKVDRMAMAHGLEVRSPFLDYRLVEFAARVPSSLKLKFFHQKKYLLKAAMRNRLPGSIIRRKKEGFNIPNARWMRGKLKPFVLDTLSASRLSDMQFLDSSTVQQVLMDHFNGKADNSHQIWNLLTLSLWWQQFMAGHPLT